MFEWISDLNTASTLSKSLNTPINTSGLPVAKNLNEANVTFQASITNSWPLIDDGNESETMHEGCIPEYQHSPFHIPISMNESAQGL